MRDVVHLNLLLCLSGLQTVREYQIDSKNLPLLRCDFISLCIIPVALCAVFFIDLEAWGRSV